MKLRWSVRRKLVLSTTLVVLLSLGYFTTWVLDEFKPRQRESLEDALVDSSILLAGLVDTTNGFDLSTLERAVKLATSQDLKVPIFDRIKTGVDIRVYVTDQSGRVLYDSTGKDIGADYSEWRDVARTLKGQYGARTTQLQNEDSSTMYVSAPIRRGEEIVGVLSLGKSSRTVNTQLSDWKSRVFTGAALSALALSAMLLLVTSWITRPVQLLTEYARRVRDGEKAVVPEISSTDLGELASAFEQMRVALEGKHYVERYAQALTHEIKAPLTSIKAGSEILLESPPEAERVRFSRLIGEEAARIQHIVESLLQLSTVENRRELQNIEVIELSGLVADVIARFSPVAQRRGILITSDVRSECEVRGERFLLAQALSNLVQNALDFTGEGGTIEITLVQEQETVAIEVHDSGVGIPTYATDRVFERFYSLGRPESKVRSSGLGLSFVKEVMELHSGNVEVSNHAGRSGVQATLSFHR